MFVTIQNDRIYYNQLGNRESEKTILFIHGSSMSGVLMEDIARLLPDFNNITVDLPGHVNSGGEPRKTVEENADFITDFIRELRKSGEITDDLTVVGFSLGGCITLELALRKVPEVKRIVVLHSCDFANSELATMVPPNFEDFNPLSIGKIAFGRNSKPEITYPYLKQHQASEYVTFVDLNAAISYPMKEFETIQIPTMLITGDEDRLAPIQNVMNLRKIIPHSVLSVIPFYGHMAVLEVPEIYAQNIKDFIRHY
jgi:pimeloyl-ACP methyl ester carboxylesterase